MAPQHSFSGSSNLQIPLSSPSVYSSSLSTTYSNSTSDLSSAYSPRALYADTFTGRPHSSGSTPIEPTPKFRKSMKDITGYATTEDEFEQLPLAVRRKYFSTLERLRFAQNSRSTALNDLPVPRTRKGSLADRRGMNVPVIDSRKKHIDSRRQQRKLSRQQSVTSNEASWFLSLPEKIRKKEFTREEQVILAGRLRESVILDAADEAIYKASRRASRNISAIPDPQQSPRRTSLSSCSSTMAESIFESFRWMDEENNLDLSLNLDDYHANLDGVVLPSPTNDRRPSFRRHMSISKIPFGRNSLSSSTQQQRSPKYSSESSGHSRQKSRTMSLMSPKQVNTESLASIDPNATHYQDPEARLKLRVYLASPQKFDEAIEFGFPSMDGLNEGDKENKPVKRTSKDSAIKNSFATDKSKETFLNDDTASLFSDDVSMADPESPVTPIDPKHRASPSVAGKGSKSSADFSHLGITKPTVVKQDTYTQSMAGNREMTLRMTLTRPDLRASENSIYGWKSQTKTTSRDDPLALEELEGRYDGRGPFGGADGWSPAEKDNGVVKRFWNRVKAPRKSS
ncbi:mucin [Phlyctema vagabunda]|uniref:Mucin n=1 Tax=Phlyctema vagabunda TaxID=108571 RepID=A0ABR4P339_9HELO